MLELIKIGKPHTWVSLFAFGKFTLPAFCERIGVSPVATGAQRRRLWKPRAFEKARPKLSLTGAVREIKKCADVSSVNALSLFLALT